MNARTKAADNSLKAVIFTASLSTFISFDFFKNPFRFFKKIDLQLELN